MLNTAAPLAVWFLGTQSTRTGGSCAKVTGRRHGPIGAPPTGPFVTINCNAIAIGLTNGALLGAGGAIARALGGALFLNDLFMLPRALDLSREKFGYRLETLG